MKKLVLVAVSALVLSSSAFAGGYKSAGCGLGSMVFTDDGITQIFAATTNATFGSQMFGITTGTSNCGSGGGTSKAIAEQEIFVSANMDNLTVEMAQGNGEHLNAFASLLGCSDKAQFSAVTHKNYDQISGAKDAAGMLDAVKTSVAGLSCNNV